MHGNVCQFYPPQLKKEYVAGNDNKHLTQFKQIILKKFPKAYYALFDKKDITISLTSYPARIKTVHKTIETLLKQTIPANRIVLWLAPEQFPNKENDLPRPLLELKNKGLIINWYHDICSYKKIIPALKEYPNSFIVTADDDLIYDKFWLEDLLFCHAIDPNTIWIHRGKKITFKNGGIIPYKKWKFSQHKEKKSILTLPNSGAGVLYPPNCFHKDIFSEDVIAPLIVLAIYIVLRISCLLIPSQKSFTD